MTARVRCINCGERQDQAYNECPATDDGMGEHEWDELAEVVATLTPAQNAALARTLDRTASVDEENGAR